METFIHRFHVDKPETSKLPSSICAGIYSLEDTRPARRALQSQWASMPGTEYLPRMAGTGGQPLPRRTKQA